MMTTAAMTTMFNRLIDRWRQSIVRMARPIMIMIMIIIIIIIVMMMATYLVRREHGGLLALPALPERAPPAASAGQSRAANGRVRVGRS